jgi:excisionase family DNA binding protein
VLESMDSFRYTLVTSLQKAGLTYAEIGRKLGLSRQRVRQIARAETKAKKKPARNDPDALLTTAEAAEILNVHINTVRRWSDKGIVETYRIGSRGDRRLRQGDIDKLLRKSQPAETTYSHAHDERMSD